MKTIKRILRKLRPRIDSKAPDNAPSIFLRMPRTGTTSIEKMKIPNCRLVGGESEKFWGQEKANTHPRLWECAAERLGPERWSASFKFSTVRNPWDRAISMWRHASMGGGTFEHFCDRLERNDFDPIAAWHSQGVLFHLTNDAGEIVVDAVMRFENLQADFDRVCERIGIRPIALMHENRSQRDHYSKYYDDKTRAIVERRYRDDIEHFGYRFGE